MKILALTDIHGAYDQAVDILKKELPEVVIIGGDLTTVGTVKEAEEAVKQFQRHAERVLCIAGNMDLIQHDELFVKLGVSINGCGVVINEIGFCGSSGAPFSRLHTPYEISEEMILGRLLTGYRQILGAKRTIVVPHAPPYGTRVDIVHSGIHVGSTAVRDFIEEAQPDLVVCGHIHEARGQDSIENTRIVNCGAASSGYYAILEIEGEISMKLHHHLG